MRIVGFKNNAILVVPVHLMEIIVPFFAGVLAPLLIATIAPLAHDGIRTCKMNGDAVPDTLMFTSSANGKSLVVMSTVVPLNVTFAGSSSAIRRLPSESSRKTFDATFGQ